ARKFVISFIVVSSIFFVNEAVFILHFFQLLIKMFNPPVEFIPTIFTLILISAIAQPLLWSQSFIMPSALRAAGDSNFTSIASLLSMWLLRVILGYILGITLGFGIIGVWVAMIIEWGVRGMIFTGRFKGKKWFAHKLV
ncbi:MAG: MATE family efflux transporter, partial [Bacillus sp. (in: firmicutes)]